MVRVEVRLTPRGERVLQLMGQPSLWNRAALKQITKWVADRVGVEAKRRAPVRTAGGQRSIGVIEVQDGHAIVTQLHMLVMDEGRRPGAAMPPVEPLERWGWLVLRQRGLGFVLARSVARKGIKPRRFFDAAIQQVVVKEQAALNRKAGEIEEREFRRRAGGDRG